MFGTRLGPSRQAQRSRSSEKLGSITQGADLNIRAEQKKSLDCTIASLHLEQISHQAHKFRVSVLRTGMITAIMPQGDALHMLFPFGSCRKKDFARTLREPRVDGYRACAVKHLQPCGVSA